MQWRPTKGKDDSKNEKGSSARNSWPPPLQEPTYTPGPSDFNIVLPPVISGRPPKDERLPPLRAMLSAQENMLRELGPLMVESGGRHSQNVQHPGPSGMGQSSSTLQSPALQSPALRSPALQPQISPMGTSTASHHIRGTSRSSVSSPPASSGVVAGRSAIGPMTGPDIKQESFAMKDEQSVAMSVYMSDSDVVPQVMSNGRYQCPLCARNYKYAKHVRRHIINHTNIYPYSCPRCSALFRRKDAQRRHMQRIHPDIPPHTYMNTRHAPGADDHDASPSSA